MINKEELCDYLIDEMCERDGIDETIKFLAESGCIKKDLLELNFDEKDVNKVLVDMKAIQRKNEYKQISAMDENRTTDMASDFKSRWEKLFPGKRLLAIHLDGFTHIAYYDKRNKDMPVSDYKKMVYSGCMSMGEAQSYGYNSPEICEFFKGYPNYAYQNNPKDIIFVRKQDFHLGIQEKDYSNFENMEM